jgi:hypothetical protein
VRGIAVAAVQLSTDTAEQRHAITQTIRHLAGWLMSPRDIGFCDEIYLYSLDLETLAQVVFDWNDEHGRTGDDVIATLRAAADDWDRVHGGAQ